MRLTLDILKRLNGFEFVEEVTGDYTGTLTGIRASHEARSHIHKEYVLLLLLFLLTHELDAHRGEKYISSTFNLIGVDL
jgi:hypothetical protein